MCSARTIPLKIAFSRQRLELDDPSERALRALITGLRGEAAGDREAFVFPVFGRGRMLDPLTAAAFSEEKILQGCRYLCAACSCQVKSLNPGIDLLLAADWDAALGENLVVVDRSLPPLEGVGSIKAESAGEVAGAVADPPAAAVSSPPALENSASHWPRWRGGLGLTLGILVLLGAGSWIILRGKGSAS